MLQRELKDSAGAHFDANSNNKQDQQRGGDETGFDSHAGIMSVIVEEKPGKDTSLVASDKNSGV